MAYNPSLFIGKSQYTLYAAGDSDSEYFGDDGSNNYSGFQAYPVPLKTAITGKMVKCVTPTHVTDSGPRAVLTESGKIYAWGSQGTGLSFGFIKNPTLIQSPEVNGWQDVFVNSSRMVAIHENGKLYGTGSNRARGVADDNTIVSGLSQIGTDTNWSGSKLFLYDEFTLAIKNDGSVYWFGQHVYTHLADPSITDNLYRPGIHLLTTNIKDIVTAQEGYLYIEGFAGSIGDVKFGGIAEYGVPDSWLADGTYTSITSTTSGGSWDSFSLSSFESSMYSPIFAIKDNGDLYYWGHTSTAGAFGDNVSGTQTYSEPVLHSSGWEQISFQNGYSAFGKKNDGNLYAWGDIQTNPATGVGTSSAVLTPTLVGNPLVDDCYPPVLASNMNRLPLLSEVTRSISGDIILPFVTGEGTAENPTVYVDGSLELPLLEFDGYVATYGINNVTLSAIVINGTAESGVDALGDIVLPPIDASSYIKNGILASGNILLPAIKLSTDPIINGISATGSISIPVISLVGSGNIGIDAIGDIVLDGLIANGLVSSNSSIIISINKNNNAVSLHDKSDFNGSAEIDGVSYIARDDGLFTVDGTTDDGSNIESYIVLPTTDLKDSHAKRIRSAFISAETDGNIKVTFEFDKGSYSQIIELPSGFGGDILTHKLSGRRTPYGRYIKTKIENVDGSYMSIKELELFITQINRRITNG